MNRVNELVICKNDYDSYEEFEKAIKDVVMLLLNANYILTINYDEKGLGIVRIEYNFANITYGGAYPYWLFPEEIEIIGDDEGVEAFS